MSLLTKQLRLVKLNSLETELLILNFLSFESWTNDTNLCDLLQITKRSLRKILNAMLSKKMIKEVLVNIMGGEVLLYGITSSGVKFASKNYLTLQPSNALNSIPKLLSTRLSPTFIPHRLDIQMLRIRAERAGWTQWVNADTGQVVDFHREGIKHCGLPILVSQHRPDAWSINPVGDRVCVECERTIKSKPRYAAILCDYLLALKRGDFDEVIWVSPNIDIRNKLENLITSITHVQIGLISVLIPRNRFERFHFMTYDDWAGPPIKTQRVGVSQLLKIY